MPAAWSVLLYERCGLRKALVWVGWQAMSSSRWREATALRGQFLLLSTCPETAQDLVRAGLSPQRLLYVFESLLCEGLLSPAEAAHLEETILIQTTKVCNWIVQEFAFFASVLADGWGRVRKRRCLGEGDDGMALAAWT